MKLIAVNHMFLGNASRFDSHKRLDEISLVTDIPVPNHLFWYGSFLCSRRSKNQIDRQTPEWHRLILRGTRKILSLGL